MKNPMTFSQRLLRCKPIDYLVHETKQSGKQLKRSLTLFQLTSFGIGATIGTGIFFVLSEQVPVAGPAVLISFIIAGITAGLTALCYAELSSMIPASGSSYSYAFATLGEGVAFLVAACLILEYGVSAAAVAIGWSEYLNNLIHNVTGIHLPQWMLSAPIVADGYKLHFGGDGLINLPAAVLVFLCCLLLMRGVSESARTNAIMVIVKLVVLILFIAIAATAFDSDNLTPFSPHGFAGISAAAGSIFFTFIGLDAVSTAGEEIENPRRNLPLAIISALCVVIIFYVLVALTALGAQQQGLFEGQQAGLAVILQNITGSAWPAIILAAGAVISVFSITLVVLYGQTRILFAMSRDGLAPKIFHRVNPRTLTPNANTLIVACIVSTIAAFIPADVLWDLTSMGTLIAFTVVSIGVMVLRYRMPDASRGFKVPFFPMLPILSICACLYLIASLSGVVYTIAAIWAIIAGIYYFCFAAKNSVLEQGSEANIHSHGD
ncbi:amino acid permease [Acinetobacter qingfengensis]|uniref:Amino acid permease n=1 Tax=Acinetobacter qingfengensis TaxID=1262585 RepID=A0A1E7QZU4_9GAMM|nr:amino acid permease [Acinetobacter qingfengensis]KAA8734786.1 amino acid permease [Acinetobacter qingfengensis]OEY92526.1 amino acid permease [Acinetobacter qingfengensis]